MISHYFLLPSIMLASFGILHYLYLAYKGKVKPNSVSWFFWSLSPFIGHMIMLSEGVKFIDSIPLFIAWSLNSLVFLTSVFNKNAYWKLGKTDYIFAISALLAIFVWQVLDNPFWALLFAILGDVCAGIPTLIKCWRHPDTESLSPYLLPMPNLMIGLLVLPTFTFYNAGYTGWILFSNFLKVTFISRKYFKFN